MSIYLKALLFLALPQVTFWFALIQPIQPIQPIEPKSTNAPESSISRCISSCYKALICLPTLSRQFILPILAPSTAHQPMSFWHGPKSFWTHFQLHLITYQSVTFRSLKQLQNQLAVTQCRHKIYPPSIWRALRLNWWLSGWVTTFLIHLAGSQTEGGHLAAEFRTNERPCLPYAPHRPQPSPATSLQHIAVYVFLSFLNSWRGAVLIPSTATHSDD